MAWIAWIDCHMIDVFVEEVARSNKELYLVYSAIAKEVEGGDLQSAEEYYQKALLVCC